MNKKQLKHGDLIECCGITAYVLDPNYKNDYVKVVLKTEALLNKDYRVSKALLNKDWLDVWTFANPIKDNRLVNDKTFAIRFKNFIEDIQVNDPCSEDEKEYLLTIADRLLSYQIQTATDENEINYLKRLNLL